MSAGARRLDPWSGATTRRQSAWRRLTPPQLFVASFALLVLAGTVGLVALPGLYTGRPLGWLDALFTATSAACVTGLVVVDTATFFTPLGQAYLLALIQLGGLGMITFTTLIILALGRRLSLRHERIGAAEAELGFHVPADRLARDVVLVTFGVEALGALLLWALWGPRLGWAAAAWPAVFHAVSAFCNAGFSTFSDSLIGFQRSPATLLVVGALVVLGGLGFLTFEELALRARAARRDARRGARGARPLPISVHSRLALATTGALLLAGWALFALFEWHGTLAGLSVGERVVNALFLSLTPRTAGFNSIDYARASDSTNFLTILLMFVGGSPGSTAGGIKTTTLALLVLLAWDRFRGREITDFGHRSIPEATIQRAVGLTIVAFAVVTASIFVYTWTERADTAAAAAAGVRDRAFLSHMYEAVSAFNTVGLSMGVTGTLSPPGKLVTVLLMFVGRVGPLTFAAALATASAGHPPFRHAYEDVVVG